MIKYRIFFENFNDETGETSYRVPIQIDERDISIFSEKSFGKLFEIAQRIIKEKSKKQ